MADITSPGLKIRRAKKHLGALRYSFNRFVDRNPYEIVDCEGHTDASQITLCVKVHKFPPVTWPLMVADACQNIVTALDQLFWQVCLDRNPAISTRRDIYFPVGRDGVAFESIRQRYATLLSHPCGH